jgi:hypothetical protein
VLLTGLGVVTASEVMEWEDSEAMDVGDDNFLFGSFDGDPLRFSRDFLVDSLGLGVHDMDFEDNTGDGQFDLDFFAPATAPNEIFAQKIHVQ